MFLKTRYPLEIPSGSSSAAPPVPLYRERFKREIRNTEREGACGSMSKMKGGYKAG